MTTMGAPVLLPHSKLEGMTPERMKKYNALLEKEPNSYTGMKKRGHHLEWRRAEFGTKKTMRAYPAWIVTATGEELDPPNLDLDGPTKRRFITPYGKVALANFTPEYMTSFEPSEGLIFVRPVDQDGEPDPAYDEAVCGEFNEVMKEMNKFFNEDRVK
jgi:hypothetical protein